VADVKPLKDMRAIWKGSISFGLVNIPISLVPAVRKEAVKFRLLRKSDLSPVNYKRVAEADGQEVPWDQIIKGYEYEKDLFVPMEEKDFERADLQATQTVNIVDFVSLKEIDPIYFDKPYYLQPEKGGSKAYVLLRDTLVETGKVGIAKVVIKTREHLGALKPKDNLLVLELMHFAQDLADPQEVNAPTQETVGKREIDMAKSLVASMTSRWDPTAYKDEYQARLVQVIEEKLRTGAKDTGGKTTNKKPTTNVVDLLTVLQKSIAEASSKTKTKATKARKGKAA
jgi:DNA end-binding protein Ku